ncbi:MAG: PAS domain-containing sensor histidine kinase [Deltaproteobacteria bacterium]|nr:PAS domain-containing sensor histidine kinase [Deltaproteobacteria bacterium]
MPKICSGTMFLPPERSSGEDIRRQREKLLEFPLLKTIVDGIPDGVLILNNPTRQIIIANSALLEALGLEHEQDALGKRPGEALGCIHSAEHSSGCGTSESCRHCGAAKVLNQCRMGRKAADECRIICIFESETKALDLLIWGTPFSFGDQDLILFAVADISHEKRRRVLERIFFHDFLNTAGGLRSLAELLLEEASAELNEIVQPMYEAADILINEIESQRQLVEAENGEMEVNWSQISCAGFLRELAGRCRRMEVAKDRHLRIDSRSPDVEITTDYILLNRVLSNLVKNALESSGPGETVSVGYLMQPDRVEFWVHNQTELPEDIRLQLFKRSFSTKGPGRGLGLYSVRLLTERYLRGKVLFTSSSEEGTIFRINLPLSEPADRPD